MISFKDISPTAAAGDLVAYLREDRPYKFPLLVAACIPPALMTVLLYLDARETATPPPPEVMYFESWPLTRSIEESKAAIAISGIEKTKQLEASKEAYRAIGRASGLDVDAMERDIAAQRKAEEAAKTLDDGKKPAAPGAAQ